MVYCDRCGTKAGGDVRPAKGWVVLDVQKFDGKRAVDCLVFCPDCAKQFNLWRNKENPNQ